jgi:hypothetical protein
MSNFVDHNWSNSETRAIAYHLFNFEGDALEFNEEEWLRKIIRENPDKSLEELTGIAILQESGEPGYPDRRIEQAAERLELMFTEHSIGLIPAPYLPAITSITIIREEGGKESLSGSDVDLILELLDLALDRVDWEEIFTVWLEGQRDLEEPGNEVL